MARGHAGRGWTWGWGWERDPAGGRKHLAREPGTRVHTCACAGLYRWRTKPAPPTKGFTKAAQKRGATPRTVAVVPGAPSIAPAPFLAPPCQRGADGCQESTRCSASASLS